MTPTLPEPWALECQHSYWKPVDGKGDAPGGQHVGVQLLWLRVTKDGTPVTDWARAIDRSQWKALQWWKLVESVEDIPEAWTGSTGQPWSEEA